MPPPVAIAPQRLLQPLFTGARRCAFHDPPPYPLPTSGPCLASPRGSAGPHGNPTVLTLDRPRDKSFDGVPAHARATTRHHAHHPRARAVPAPLTAVPSTSRSLLCLLHVQSLIYTCYNC